VKLEWAKQPSVCVVMAAHGYPATPRTGDVIRGIDAVSGMDGRPVVFQAGTKIGPKGLETAGGRVLGVTAAGPDLKGAIANAYAAVDKISFEGAHWRRDIGAKGLKRW
jgi:phosphoribosylamine--glycine ligase